DRSHLVDALYAGVEVEDDFQVGASVAYDPRPRLAVQPRAADRSADRREVGQPQQRANRALRHPSMQVMRFQILDHCAPHVSVGAPRVRVEGARTRTRAAAQEKDTEQRDGEARHARRLPLPAMRQKRRSTPLGFQPPAVGDEEIAAVAETLRSGWLTTGPKAAELEQRMADYLEAEYVLALASGTAAIHLALVALGVGPGDEVITTPITWPATANVIVHTGATPVFVDVRDEDLNIDPELVAEAVTEQTKAILPVDLAGQP